MKKGLSLFLAASLAISSFSTAALAADELTAEEKYNALVQAGIFEGFPDGQAHLDQNMTRAQAAKVITLVLGLEENPAAAAVYNDLQDAQWAAGYIGAATAAGILEGYGNGIFDPSADVTIEQLAKIMVEALDIEVDEDATVDGASDWAGKYVAAALKAGLIPEQSDYTVPASRQLLVEASYAAYETVNVPAQAGIQSAKPTGVQKVTVQLNRPVDTATANLVLKKGAVTINTTTEWAQDGKSAVLNLTETRITAGEYTVTLSGVENLDSNAAVARFTAENEKIEKLEFLTASDTLAYAESVIVKVAALNQYGEPAATNAGSYNVYTPSGQFQKISKASDGTLIITLNTTVGGMQQGVSVLPVTVVNNDSQIQATKNFKIGTQPILSKAELGQARYSNNANALVSKGDVVRYDFYIYDQYGNEISYEAFEDEYKDNTTIIWNTYMDSGNVKMDIEDNGNNIPQLKLTLQEHVDKSGEYSFTVFNQAANATGKVNIESSKVAVKVEIGDVTDVIAAGDEDVYIPIIAYDAHGNILSTEDLVDNADRISISLSGARGKDSVRPYQATIETSGANKGKVKLTQIEAGPRGVISVTAVIATPNASSTATKTFVVQDARIPDRFRIVTAPVAYVAKGTASSDATQTFEIHIIDQYGKKMNKFNDVDGNGRIGGTIDYNVTVTATTYDADGTVLPYNDALRIELDSLPAAHPKKKITGTVVFGNDTDDDTDELSPKIFNEKFKVVATRDITDQQKLVLNAVITKDGTEISKLSRTIEVVDPTDNSLTYVVSTAPAIFNARDNVATKNHDTVKGAVYNSKLAHEVKVTARKGGENVALPGSIVAIASSDIGIAEVEINSQGKAYVIGKKTGSATLNVVYRTVKGETKQASVPVTVKSDPITVETLTAKNDEKTYGTTDVTAVVGGFKLNAKVQEIVGLEVVDNYGVKYDKPEHFHGDSGYNYVLGLTFSVQNVRGSGNVSIDQYTGEITVTGDVSFDLVVTAPNGKQVVTAVIVDTP